LPRNISSMIRLLPALAAVLAATPLIKGPWIEQDEYPTSMPGKDSGEGITRIEVLVDETGSIDACKIALSSGVHQLDQRACDLTTKRVRFKPAADDRGRPLYGTYQLMIGWVQDSNAFTRQPADADLELIINRAPAGIPLPAYVRIAYLVDPTGKALACNAAKQDENTEALGELACRGYLSQAPLEPVHNHSGEAVTAVKLATVKFSLNR
jgi:TonB family protein